MAGPAAAAPPVETSGTYTAVITNLTAPEGSGTAVFFEFSNAITLSGSYTGTGTADYDCVQVGTQHLRCRGEQHLTATVDGVGTGTLTNRVVLTCDLTTGVCTSVSVNLAGTGELADVHAVTRSRSILGQPGGTYEGQLVVAGG